MCEISMYLSCTLQDGEDFLPLESMQIKYGGLTMHFAEIFRFLCTKIKQNNIITSSTGCLKLPRRAPFDVCRTSDVLMTYLP